MAAHSESDAYVQWYEENAGTAEHPRPVRAAWLVRDVGGWLGARREFLAYLGRHPRVTESLREELAVLYPHVHFDWAAIQRALEAGRQGRDVAALTDDELVLHLRELARERGLSLMDLALRLGYYDRQIMPELMTLLDDTGRIARFERTAGSIFDYMARRHPDYAYLIYKARLFFEGNEQALRAAIAGEPQGFDDAAWRARRRYWSEQLERYRQARRAPPGAE